MCDTMVVVGEDGVLFAKNSDRDPNEPQVLDWQPRREHAPGSRVRCTWVDVDQAATTHAVLLSRPFWMFGAEMGVNEHGVAIGNEAVFTRRRAGAAGGADDPSRPARQQNALTGMDLVRLGLERATTADGAVEVIVGLLERHGQGGRCGHEHPGFSYDSSFLIADRLGAVVLETAGRHWCTEAVTSGARAISNGLTIPTFADRHSQVIRTRASGCRTRRAITESAAHRATVPASLMAALRDHGAGAIAPRYSLATGAMSAPCMHAGGLVAGSQTTASWVSALAEAGDQHWVTATAAPCTGLFKPVDVHDPLDLGPQPTDRFDARTLWWRHELLHRRSLTNPERLLARFVHERDATEARWLTERPSPTVAFAEASVLLDRWSHLVWHDADRSDHRPWWVRRYWATRNERAAFPDHLPGTIDERSVS